MAPPGQSSAQTRPNTPSTRAWALCTRPSHPCLWSRAYRYPLTHSLVLLVPCLASLLIDFPHAAKRRRRCGHVGADGTELHSESSGLVWGRRGRNHVQVCQTAALASVTSRSAGPDVLKVTQRRSQVKPPCSCLVFHSRWRLCA